VSDLKLFSTAGGSVHEIEGHSIALEKSLQTLIEKHLETFLGVRFLSSEHPTGKTHGGRIDTLGIDENGCPVIIEYKRALNENVINQGLFYLDWLMDHQADFRWLVLERLGKEAADTIEWGSPRLVCIAGDFTKYDEHAVQQINRNIELLRYRRFGDELLLLELVNAVTAAPLATGGSTGAVTQTPSKPTKPATVSDLLQTASPDLQDRYERLRAELLALGDDVQEKTLKFYFAFKRIKNFACVEVHPQAKTILIYVKVNPDTVELEDGFTRDVRSIRHFGTDDLEIRVKTDADLERARPLLLRSYEAS
jgi:predicted transport protein